MLHLADSTDELLLTLAADTTILGSAVLHASGTAAPPLTLGGRLLDLVPERDRETLLRSFARAGEDSSPSRLRLRFAGRQDDVELSLNRLNTPEGPLTFACLVRRRAVSPSGCGGLDDLLACARAAWFERDLESGVADGSASLAVLHGMAGAPVPWQCDELDARMLPEDRSLAMEEFASLRRRAGEGHPSTTFHYRIRQADGTLRHLEARCSTRVDDASRRARGLVFDVTESKQIEQRLLETQHWLNLALGSAGITLWNLDLDTRIVRIWGTDDGTHSACDKPLLWRYEDLLATIEPGGREAFAAALDAWREGDVAPQPRFTIKDRHGTPRWMQATGNVEFDDDGRPSRIVGVSWNVSATVEQELARKASDDRLARITDLMPGVVYQFRRSKEGRYSMPYASNGLLQFGVRPEHVRDDASALFALIHPDDRPALYASIVASARSLARWQHEMRVLLPDGALRRIYGIATPQPEADGAVLWHGHIVDVTEHREAAQLLRDSQQRLALALGAARMSTWHWDLSSDRVTTSDDMRQLFGLDPDGVPSSVVLDRIHPEDRAAVNAQFEAAMRASEDATFTVEYRYGQPNGKYRYIELRMRAVRDPNGQVIAFDGLSLDIHQRRRAEAERERLQRRLAQSQKMEAIGLLTGGIAHDFNNILASVLGYSSLALQRFGDANPPKFREYLREVVQAGERARDLVTQMLAFSRGENVEVTAVDTAALIAVTMKMLRPTLPSSIAIDVQVEPSLPPVLSNAIQLQQVLLNLCINARDAMNAAGDITIVARSRHYDAMECASCHQLYSGDHIELSVSDTGTGIPDEEIARIFEPFFTTKAERKGSGMGLATVHGIMHRHGGHIGLISRRGIGSRFWIALPVAATPPSAEPRTASAPTDCPAAAWPAHILVVDDEVSIARVTTEILEIAGFIVEYETDPLRAVTRLREAPCRFDLLITDQTMPRMTGHELARAAMAERADFPVLLVTGHSTVIDEPKALALGIRAFLRKPLARETLLKAVAAALPPQDRQRQRG